RSMWSHKKDLSPEETNSIRNELEILEDKLEISTTLNKKLSILEKLLELAEILKDDRRFINYQEIIKQTNDEIRDTTIKLNYYLEKVKKTINQAVMNLGNKPINEGDYKDVYLNLFSFSNKLKLMIDNNKWEVYRDYANTIINKDKVSREELSDVISTILKMKENIEDYLN
ncbi:MAG: hypothetical protein ACFFAO_10120, partial [Candidatus Hermodarchaeota archaeon]